jgi:MFS family permease
MALHRQIDAAVAVSRAAPGATSFAVMFALESMARATLATVIPIQAYDILRDARDVSALFLAVAGCGLAASFAIPLLVGRIGRRRVYPIGGACLILCAAALATGTLTGQVAGMLLRVFGAACLNITLSLYIMDYIHKRDLVRSEPRKFLFSAAAWTIGPSLGVFLQTQIGEWSPYVLSGLFSLLLLANFWRLRLRDDPAVSRATKPPPNPFASIGRFMRQPRLRLAWAIAFARSCWWGIFLNYLPLVIVSSGVDPEIGGLMVSCGNAMLFLTPLWGRIGARFGLRASIAGAFAVAGGAAAAAFLMAPFPLLAAVIMTSGALGATCLDALGTIPFLRAVHPYERPQMVTVYRTNQDAADFVTNTALSVLLSLFALPVVFLAAAVTALALAIVSRHLPRSM